MLSNLIIYPPIQVHAGPDIFTNEAATRWQETQCSLHAMS